MEEIEPAELPIAQAAERRGRVAILVASVRFQMRYSDRERGETVVVKGEAGSAKQLGRGISLGEVGS